MQYDYPPLDNGTSILISEEFLAKLQRELLALKALDKAIERVVPDKHDQLEMHNIIGLSLVMFQLIIENVEQTKIREKEANRKSGT